MCSFENLESGVLRASLFFKCIRCDRSDFFRVIESSRHLYQSGESNSFDVMRVRSFLQSWCCVSLLLAVFCGTPPALRSSSSADSGPASPQSQHIFSSGFLACDGLLHVPASDPAPSHVAFFSRSNVFVHGTRISHVLRRPLPLSDEATFSSDTPALTNEGLRRSELYRVDFDLLSANPSCLPRMEKPREFRLRRNAAPARQAHERLVFGDAWPGIDFIVDANDAGFKSEFHLTADADPSRIKTAITGATDIYLDAGGALVVVTPMGDIREHAPFAYQNYDGRVVPVACRFALDGNIVAFELGDYDRSRDLIIDPTVEWKTLYGGNAEEVLREILCDTDGSLLATGYSGSLDFPATVGQITLAGAVDCFVVRFNAFGVPQWATLIGGSDADRGVAISLDSQGRIGLVGSTLSADFPRSGFSPPKQASEDAFVAQLDAAGALNWAVLFGGRGSDFALDLSSTAAGALCMVGVTGSNDLNATVEQTALSGSFDGFLAMYAADGAFSWASYLGGTSVDQCFGITRKGNDFIVVGQTRSTNFPVTGGQTTLGGDYDAFVTKVASDGTRDWGTYLGGSRLDGAQDVTIASDGGIIVTGFTASPDFGADRGKICLSAEDVFIAKMRPNGLVEWKTLFGGNAGEPNGATIGLKLGPSIAAAADGSLFLSGATASTDLPAGIGQTTLGGDEDLYLAQFCAEGGLEWSTYCGSTGKERGFGLALDGRGNVYFGGWTNAPTFPTTIGRTTVRGNADAVLAKVALSDTCAFSLTIEPPGPLEICRGERRTVRAVSPQCYALSDFRWVDVASGSIVGRGAEFEATRAGIYEVRASGPCACDVVGSIVVEENDPPNIVELRDTVFCLDGNAVRLQPRVESDAGPLKYRWVPATGLSNVNIAAPFASPEERTTYLLTVEDRNGCVATSTVVVDVAPSPEVELEDALMRVCRGTSLPVRIRAAGPNIEYLWTPADLVDDPRAAQPNVKGVRTARLYMRAENQPGCVKLDSILVQVVETELTPDLGELDFGLLGDCSEGKVLSLVLNNSGADIVRVDELNISGGEYNIVAPVSLPQFVSPDETLEVRVRYSPNASGVHSAALTIVAGPCETELEIDLRGQRDELALTLSPPQLDFGLLTLCEQAEDSLTVRLNNSSNVEMNIDGLDIPAPFSLVHDVLPITLAADESLDVAVLLNTTTSGELSAELQVDFSNSDCAASRFVSVNADVQRPHLQFTTAAYDMGVLAECEFDADSVATIVNTGQIPISDIVVEPGPGLALLNAPPDELAPGEQADLVFRMTAAGLGVSNSSIQVSFHPCELSTGLNISIERRDAALRLPGELDFEFVEFCPATRATRRFTIENVSADQTVTITDMRSPAPFNISAVPPLVLAAGTSVDVSVDFAPLQAGEFMADLEIDISSCAEPLRIPLRARSSGLILEHPDVDFGAVTAGRLAQRSVTATNASAEPIFIESVEAPITPFSILLVAPPPPVELQPGESIRVDLEFDAAEGEFADLLLFNSRSQCAAGEQLGLRGRGTPRRTTTSTVALPDVQFSVYERAVRIPLILTEFAPATTSQLEFNAAVRFNSTVFNPLAAEGANLLVQRNGGEVSATLDGIRSGAAAGDTLAWIIGDVLLGNEAESAIEIESFAWSYPQIGVERVDGSLRLLELCERGDNTRLLDYVDQYGIHLVHPNPSAGDVEILVRTLEAAPTQFRVVDVNGRAIKSEQLRPESAGQWFHLRYADLPRGTYTLILSSPARIATERLLVAD